MDNNNVETQLTEEVSKKSSKGKIIGIILAVVGAIAGVLGFVGYKKRHSQNETEEVIEVESETENVEE